MEIPRILVAGDDPDTPGELLEIVLGCANFRVTVTDDRIKVLELLSIDFDAVLLDNLMPKMNGIELCRRIRATNKLLSIQLD